AEQRIKQWPLKEQWQALKAQVQTTSAATEAPEATPLVVIAAEVICQVDSPEQDKAVRFQWQLEQLPKMMTQGQANPMNQMEDLFQQHQAQLNEGLAPEHQARILNALAAIQPSRSRPMPKHPSLIFAFVLPLVAFVYPSQVHSTKGHPSQPTETWVIHAETVEPEHRQLWENTCTKAWQKAGIAAEPAFAHWQDKEVQSSTLQKAQTAGFTQLLVLDTRAL